MRTSAYAVLLFFVCLNVSLFIISETEVLPQYAEPYETPTDIRIRLVGSFTVLTVTIILSGIVGQWLVGVAVGLLLWVLDFFIGTTGIISWIFLGFPEFIERAAMMSGADLTFVYVITGATNALMAVVWFWFIMGLVSQRGTLEI